MIKVLPIYTELSDTHASTVSNGLSPLVAAVVLSRSHCMGFIFRTPLQKHSPVPDLSTSTYLLLPHFAKKSPPLLLTGEGLKDNLKQLGSELDVGQI